jgi:hypothetical protein
MRRLAARLGAIDTEAEEITDVEVIEPEQLPKPPELEPAEPPTGEDSRRAEFERQVDESGRRRRVGETYLIDHGDDEGFPP